MFATSRTPLFILLVSFVLTALQGCGADCKELLKESGLPYEDEDGKEVEGSKDCGYGDSDDDDGTEAPGRLLEDTSSKKTVIRGFLPVVTSGRALEGRRLNDFCKAFQKPIDCFGGKDGAMCGCTCKEFHEDPEKLDEKGFFDGCEWTEVDDKGEEEKHDLADKTMKEIIKMVYIDGPLGKLCDEADSALKSPCEE